MPGTSEPLKTSNLLGCSASTTPISCMGKKEDSRLPEIQQYVQWVDQFFEFRGGEIYLRNEPVQPLPALPDSTKKGIAKATPPYPPLPNKCQNCQEFSFRGSTGYTIRRTCLR